MKAFWERRVKVEGSYVFDHGENLEAYFKAIGEDVTHDNRDYKLHMHEDGKVNLRLGCVRLCQVR